MTLQRILTAAVLIPLVVFAVLYTPSFVALLVAIVTVLGLREFFKLAAQAGAPGYARWTSFCAVMIVFTQFFVSGPWSIMLPVGLAEGFAWSPGRLVADVVLFMFGTSAIACWSKAPLEKIIPAIGTSSAGLLFVALPLSFIVRLHRIDIVGPRILLFVLVFIWVGDTFAYFVGRQFGRHPMSPLLSPKKTWEGSVANLAGSLLVAAAASRWVALAPAHLFFMAVLGNVAGQLGDLMESAYKRAAGAKDSSALLPGHGGVLDRIDSLIFAIPVVWYYFRFTSAIVR